MTVPLVLGSSVANTVKTYPVNHPESGKLVHHVSSASKDDLDVAVQTCHAALPSWSDTPIEIRAGIINKAADLLEGDDGKWKEKMRLANLAETSVSPWWAAQQLAEVAAFLRALTTSAQEALSPWTVCGDKTTTYMTREPFGVCLAMAAWNAIPMLTSRAIATPLIAGNTVVLKTSEIAPYSQLLWAELLYEAGLPRGALTVVHISLEDAPSLTPVLVQHKLVRHVNFTGSTRVGSILAGLAGQSLKPSIMELGGKAPVLLLGDADLETAASHIIFGAMMNAGQICMSTERVFVAGSQYDNLTRALRSAWSTLQTKEHRALFTAASAARARELVEDATEQGIQPILEAAPGDIQASSALVAPQIYGPATPSMRIYREETFAPICVVIPVPDSDRTDDEVADEMVRLANESDYGLSASVWSRNEAVARRVAAQLESGAVHINSPTCHDLPHVPHGGWKSSGWGRFNGIEGIRGFTQTRSVEVPNSESKPMPLNLFDL